MQKLKAAPYFVQPEFFSQPKYMLHTHFLWKPLYGKSALMNSKVVNHETFFFAGPGITHYEKTYSSGQTESEDAMSLSFGAGFKYFLNQSFCLNAELRDILNFRKDENENNLAFSMGLGYRFNLAPRKVEEDPTVKKLDRILSE
jgi:outer membrane beta-barrel protein